MPDDAIRPLHYASQRPRKRWFRWFSLALLIFGLLVGSAMYLLRDELFGPRTLMAPDKIVVRGAHGTQTFDVVQDQNRREKWELRASSTTQP